MWKFFAKIVLRFRLLWLILLVGTTIFMVYKARELKMAYNFAKIIPATDPNYIKYTEFRTIFGEDGNVMVLGVSDDRIFQLDFFNDWFQLGNDIKKVGGITEIISIPHAYNLVKDTATRSFKPMQLVNKDLNTQEEVDSIKNVFLSLPFYQNLIYNSDNQTSLMAITFNKKELDSEERLKIVDDINLLTKVFSKKHKVEVHASGLPFIRSVNATLVQGELKKFLTLSILIASLVLFILFRNFQAVILSLLVVAIGVIWAMGTIVLLGFKISILTGLIPALLVVIGIPNCVYIINKYHAEYKKHADKDSAVSRVIERIGQAAFFTNLTTATGFGVFCFTSSRMLQEFGLVASLNVAGTFIISIITLPLLFSYLPPPKESHTNHLDFPLSNKIVNLLDKWIRTKRKMIYLFTFIISIVAIVGMLKLESRGYIFDDLPKDTKELQDLRFFEKNFSGALPFELMIDTKKKGKATQLSTLQKLDKVQDTISAFDEFSRPISLVEGIKFANQAFYNGNASQYRLPNSLEKNFVFSYLSRTKNEKDLLESFVDSSRQITRISVEMMDIGSHKLPDLLERLDEKLTKILDPEEYNIHYTGTSLIVMEGNNYLINGLLASMAGAFIIIAILMGVLFRSFIMTIISLIPNVIPLLITAGIMGYFNIPLKPSTVLIFSIAFGISVDDTIHFLAKYKQELLRHDWNISKTVSTTLQETAISMTYTSIILFFGFIVFTASDFNGTVNLGILTSITLIVAMFTNLVLLPCLLLSLEKYINRKTLANTGLTID